ncbi:alpha/beta fold hydrolase [Dactylosporangium matsuzakiense]|uniref:AB hydrolase-1 domain-containing protein n=1 Tax=Dactylosporangium matsuzakiense TaxID=53360 RepID=A0A9W6KMQ5_9ACTN|nr:alpha/beta hydrolase [Dactylosporangium matsuzakiense]GLL04876.1 hypothetical protein GCM10017581_066230 [Dactylosporangium matsuzakiense]
MIVVAIPGTLCSPAVFRRLSALADVEAVSWMTEPGPWDLETVADRLAARYDAPVALLGHSTGGAIALTLTARHPGLVAALMLVDTGATMHGHGDVDTILTALASAARPQVQAAVLDRSFAAPLDPPFRAELLDYAAAVPPEAAIEALRSQRDTDLTPFLAGIAVPVTVVHGIHDPVRSTDQARALAAAIPGARLRLLDAGHTPVHEAPAEVAAELRALLARA